MKKLALSLLTASCALALTACSSHSGGSDNSAELRQTENSLRQQILALEAKINGDESSGNANSSSNAEELKAANDSAIKSAAEAAKATQQEKETAKKLADLELAQAKAEQASNKQNDTESNKRIAELEAKAKQAAQDLENARDNAQKANATLEQLKLAEQQAQQEKAAATKRLQDLENLQSSEKARIPVSDLIFGGVSGQMKKSVANVSGGVWTEKNKQWEVNLPATTEGLSDLLIVDKTGRTRHVALSDSTWGREGVSQEYSIYSSSTKFPDVRFGMYVDGLDGSQAIYSQGNATPEAQVPTSGTAKYEGAATHAVDGQDGNDYSKLTADVNFANKTIDFTVDRRRKVPEMKFAAKITANSFAGEVNNIKTQGGFFGENASQLSGLYINEQEKEQGTISRGAYGAVKTKE